MRSRAGRGSRGAAEHLRRPRAPAWYVRAALEARRVKARAVTTALTAAVALAGCGGGGERQDENEPEGTFRVDVVRAEFPDQQKLAKRSTIEIEVRNADTKTIPNVAVTLKGLDRRKEDPRLADPERPVFVVNGVPELIGGLPESREAAPRGGETAFVDTWALGELKPGETKTFEWSVTAVDAGPYKLSYAVSAGLDGKAKAVLASGQPPAGVFSGEVADEPPSSRIGSDGRTVIRDDEEK